MKRTLAQAALLLVAVVAAPTPAAAGVITVPVTTVSSPVFVTHAGDRRLFIVELAGRIRVYDRNSRQLLPTPFLDISAKVSTGGERGLFSVAFHPDYPANGLFYVYYTDLAGSIAVERYHVTANANVADPNSAAMLLVIPKDFANHNGGQLQIGPRDGYLYLGTGDGGSANNPSCHAQDASVLLGKILRLDVRQNLTTAPFYGIPADNPFAGAGNPGADEIWAAGVRNPWRFSFDRSNGDLYIGDVGQSAFEEIDLHRAASPAGANFGWKVMEGNMCASSSACPAGTPACDSAQFTAPIFTYPTSNGCAVIGGYFYRGGAVPALAGRYLFGDYCNGQISTLTQSGSTWTSQALVNVGPSLTSFGEDSDGEVYVTAGDSVLALASDAAPVPAMPSGGVAVLALALAGLAARLRARR